MVYGVTTGLSECHKSKDSFYVPLVKRFDANSRGVVHAGFHHQTCAFSIDSDHGMQCMVLNTPGLCDSAKYQVQQGRQRGRYRFSAFFDPSEVPLPLI